MHKFDRVYVGRHKLALRLDELYPVVVCAWCGKDLSLKELRLGICSNETGYFYCSDECAKEHIKAGG